jgi:transcription antitermination factor NusG
MARDIGESGIGLNVAPLNEGVKRISTNYGAQTISDRSGLPEASALQWFAVYTNSRHEKKVAHTFADRSIPFFLPLYRTRREWKNRHEARLDLPLFPNYVFVHIDHRERVKVLGVPGVLSLVGVGRVPAPLPDFEIEALRSGLAQCAVEPHPFLVIGERVRICCGPMTGMEGVLLRRKNNFRVVLALDAIMKCIAVEVAVEDVESIFPFRTGIAKPGPSPQRHAVASVPRMRPRTWNPVTEQPPMFCAGGK